MNIDAATTRLQLINGDHAVMADIAKLAQSGGVAVVERGGEFAFCDRQDIPAGWKRFTINEKAAA